MLEPQSRTENYLKEQEIMLSQAISLKRIADALERLQVAPKQPIMMSAEEYARYKELKDIPTSLDDIIFNKS